MVNLWGPGAFGAARPAAVRPSYSPVNNPGDPDDWFKDCSSPTARDGTEWRSASLNKLLAVLRQVVRKSTVPADNADDDLLAKAIASGSLIYAVATGTANAWIVAPNLAVPAYAAARVLNIIAPATNTSPTVNMNVSGLGDRRIKKSNGADPAIGDLVSGNVYATIDDGTNIRILTPLPSDVASGLALNGQCIVELSGGNLVLRREGGTQIIVDGAARTIPAAGVSLAATGNANNTTYFIYAYVNAGVLTLERSTTGRAQHTDGTWIKSGDATRALVSVARSNASGAWVDSPQQRFVRSFFNRKARPLWNRFTTNRSTAALEGSKVELSSEIRCEFVCFSDDSIAATSAGYLTNSGSNFSYCAVTFDGTATDTGTISAAYGSSGSVLNAARNAGPGLNALADGYHYATLTGYVSGGTGTWGGGDSNTPTCAIHAMLH